VLLREKFAFKVSDSFSIAHLCKEITRVTGKRIVWFPEEAGQRINSYEYGGASFSLPPPDLWRDEHSLGLASCCRLELGVVLDYALSILSSPSLIEGVARVSRTAAPFADSDWPYDGVWTAWVGDEAIFFILLPKRIPSIKAAQVPVLERSPSECDIKGDPYPLPQLVALVVPSDYESGERLQMAVPSAVDQEALLRERVVLREGKYSFVGFPEEIARAAGKRLVWLPELSLPTDSRLRLPTGIFEAAEGKGQLLGYILARWLAEATEHGVGRSSPDREIWTALVGEDAIFLIMLPDAF